MSVSISLYYVLLADQQQIFFRNERRKNDDFCMKNFLDLIFENSFILVNAAVYDSVVNNCRIVNSVLNPHCDAPSVLTVSFWWNAIVLNLICIHNILALFSYLSLIWAPRVPFNLAICNHLTNDYMRHLQNLFPSRWK